MSDHAYAYIAGMLFAIGLVSMSTGRSPVRHAAVALLNARAIWHWCGSQLWPAVRVAAARYPESLDEVRRWR